MTENLHNILDDMVAFIEGHGLRRFHAYIEDEVPSVFWQPDAKAEAWKDVVELAKASNAAFVTLNSFTLTADNVKDLVERLRKSNFPNDDDVEEAQLLRMNIGKVGFIQIGFPSNGVMFLYELTTPWYE